MDRTKYKRLGCWMPLCEGKHKALGLCSAHYEQHKSKTLFKELALSRVQPEKRVYAAWADSA